ncbi:MAG: response regulator, partial [Syntrophomonas sp.]|nr:response regulator [Syntrophomonas sp.]
MDKSIKILIIEDDAGDRLLLQQVLSETGGVSYKLHIAERLTQAMEMLGQNSCDIILLDLNLPDSSGIRTFEEFFDKHKDIPIVILSGLTDELVALDAVRKGAQDYLMKNEITPALLKRVINYAIERNGLIRKLSEKSMTDDLTGLYNRSGFFTMSQQQLDLAPRIQKKTGLFFMDLDGMKEINDLFGHLEGDRALITLAVILKE